MTPPRALLPRALPSRGQAVELPGLWWLRIRLAVTLLLHNLVGAVVVYALAALVVPLPQAGYDHQLRLQNLVLATIYVLIAIVYGLLRGLVVTRNISTWLREQREPDDRERRAVLRAPGRLMAMQGGLWGFAAIAFGTFNALHSPALGGLVALIVGLAGLSSSAVTYLLAERVLRPLARAALTAGVPARVGLRLGLRTMLAWLLGSGITMLGVGLAGLTPLFLNEEISANRLAITMVALGGLGFVAGGFTSVLAARATTDPVRALRNSMAEVSTGHLDAEVPIYDGTELGVLQAGFNEMLHGLREREQIHDLFGRHVGIEVARAALEEGITMGGEVRDVAVLFVDIIGSTTIATDRPPEEVVGLLNRFFDVVIDVVHEYGGLINKFQGDAALAIWGAPVPFTGQAQAVLGAARTLGVRLAREVPELEAGVGVSAGLAVAGNVGAAERYEYTVIGDPVNEAARLTELAKTVPGFVVANATLLDRAGDEATRWQVLDPVTVRGRTTPTLIAVPVVPQRDSTHEPSLLER